MHNDVLINSLCAFVYGKRKRKTAILIKRSYLNSRSSSFIFACFFLGILSKSMTLWIVIHTHDLIQEFKSSFIVQNWFSLCQSRLDLFISIQGNWNVLFAIIDRRSKQTIIEWMAIYANILSVHIDK